MTSRGCLICKKHAVASFAGVLAFCAATSAPAQWCIRDADGDGHPLFGNPHARPYPEEVAGLIYSDPATSVAFGDLDGDGNMDAVVGDGAAYDAGGRPVRSSVSVLFNSGDGVMVPGALYDTARRSCSIELADLDSDGDVDIATLGELENVVSILTNNGEGAFAPYVTYPVGTAPCALKINDIDADSDPDLVVLNNLSQDLSVLRNDGVGGFGPEVRVPVGAVTPRGDTGLNRPYPGPFFDLGDLDGDGDLDVAVPAGGKVRLLWNDGQGGFSLAAVHPSVAIPRSYAVVAADLDGDGDLDLASTTLHNGNLGLKVVSVIVNAGAGTFAPPVGYEAGWDPELTAVQWATSLTAGDLDADSDLDLVVGHELGSYAMLLRNRGDGTLGPKEPVFAYREAWFVRFGEFNGDGRIDLATVSVQGRSNLGIKLNDGTGSLITGRQYPPPDPPGELWWWVEGADLDGDEDVDLVATSISIGHPYHVYSLLNDGDGAYRQVISYSLGPMGASTGECAAVGDLNGDEVPDIAVADAIVQGGFDLPGKVWTLLGNGDGTFSPPTPYPLVGVFPKHLVIADLDADSDKDLAVWTVETYPGNDLLPAERRVLVLWYTGTGQFSFGPSYTIGTYPWPFPEGAVAAADFDGDGLTDLAATAGTKHTPGTLAVFHNTGGEFRRVQTTPTPAAPWGVVPWDLEGDGLTDLALSFATFFNGQQMYLQTLSNNGTGQFEVRQSLHDDRMFGGRRPAFGVDGATQRAFVALPNEPNAVVSRVSADGTVEPPVPYGVASYPVCVALDDFNGDGRLDLACANAEASSVSILLNHSCACYSDCNSDGIRSAPDFACFQDRFVRHDPYADCNADGSLTVADFGCFQTKFVQGCP